MAAACDAAAIVRLADLHPRSGLYLLAVPDDAIAGVARRLGAVLPASALVAHTSGATPTALLAAHFERAAVFYPLQSFAAGRAVSWESLPLCVHAQDADDLEQLEMLAAKITTPVHRIDDAQRAALHVAAVFVNNFTNYLYGVGEELTQTQNVPFELLLPLVREGVDRLGTAPARALQTGPAVRGDTETQQRHLALLEKHPDYQQLYRLLSKLIAEDTPKNA